MLNKLAVLAFVTVATPALANGLPQTQDEWLVDSGRYVDGQVPSYGQLPQQNRILAYHVTRRGERLIERRSSAPIGAFESVPQGYFSTGRDQMVSATGA